MDLHKILAATVVIICLSTGTIVAQVNPDRTTPPPNGAVLPSRDNTAPNKSLDTSRAAHRRPVKPPKQQDYDGKTVTPRGTISKKSVEKMDQKDMPKDNPKE